MPPSPPLLPSHTPHPQPLPIHPNDTHYRQSYRPTPHPSSVLPAHSHPNGAVGLGTGITSRWLSGDEGTGGNGGSRSRRGSGGGGGGAEGGEGSGGAKPGGKIGEGRQRIRRTISDDLQRTIGGLAPSSSTMDRVEVSNTIANATTSLPLPEIRQLINQRILPGGVPIGTHSSSAHRSPSPATSATSSTHRPVSPLPSIADPERRERRRLARSVSASAVRSVSTVAGTEVGRSGQRRRARGEAEVPDYAEGRGGDGVSGVGIPEVGVMGGGEGEEEKGRRELVGRLKGILGCAICPPQPPTLLHRPITLNCGHTISASHLSLPLLSRPSTSALPPAEAHELEQAHQAQRLLAWSCVKCPIPTCKSHAGAGGDAVSGVQREVLASQGVRFHPPRPLSWAEAEGKMFTEGQGVVRVDVTVGKVLGLVVKEEEALREREREREVGRKTQEVEMGETDDEGDEADGEEEEETDDGGDITRSPRTATRSLRLDSSAFPFPPSSPAVPRSSSKRQRASRENSGDSPTTLTQTAPLPPKMGYGHGGGDLPMRTDQGGREKVFEKELMGMMECDVCAMMLYEPVTTPCQHTFCAKCLARSLDHSSKCPLCREEFPGFAFFQDHATNKVLSSIILTAFPVEAAERKAAIENDERDARLDTAIFVCTLAFPGMPTILHVFEPRYRLMLRRCIESGNPRFGMVLPARGTGNPHIAGLCEYGTMLEIKSIQMLPDGRSMVETVGTSRFRLLEKGSLDGYTVGRVEMIEDISIEDENALEALSIQRSRTPAAAASTSAPMPTRSRPAHPRAAPSETLINSLLTVPLDSFPHSEPSTVELMAICQSFIEQLRSGSAPWLLQRLNNTYGPMPDNATDFSYWIALVIPIDEYEKVRLLPIRSPRLRLRLIVHWVEQLRSSWWFASGCVVG